MTDTDLDLTGDFTDATLEDCREKIEAPEWVIKALLEEHKEQNRNSPTLSNQTIQAILEQEELAKIEIQTPPNPKHINDFYEAIKYLSGGIIAPTSVIAKKFEAHRIISADIRDTLLSPNTAPEEYPTSILYSSRHFLNALVENNCIDEDFWQQNNTLSRVRHSLDNIRDYLFEFAEQDRTHLETLFYTQETSRIMPVIMAELTNNRHYNLAEIAKSFTAKTHTISDDIIARVNYALEHEQPNLGLNKPPSPS